MKLSNETLLQRYFFLSKAHTSSPLYTSPTIFSPSLPAVHPHCGGYLEKTEASQALMPSSAYLLATVPSSQALQATPTQGCEEVLIPKSPLLSEAFLLNPMREESVFFGEV